MKLAFGNDEVLRAVAVIVAAQLPTATITEESDDYIVKRSVRLVMVAMVEIDRVCRRVKR